MSKVFTELNFRDTIKPVASIFRSLFRCHTFKKERNSQCKNFIFLIFFLSALILSACNARQANQSNEQFYYSHQIHRTEECEKLCRSQCDELLDTECVDALEKSYEEYKRTREEYLKEE